MPTQRVQVHPKSSTGEALIRCVYNRRDVEPGGTEAALTGLPQAENSIMIIGTMRALCNSIQRRAPLGRRLFDQWTVGRGQQAVVGGQWLVVSITRLRPAYPTLRLEEALAGRGCRSW